MPSFQFNARDVQGKSHRGTLAAENLQQVEDQLRDQNLFVVELKELKEQALERARGARDVKISRRRLIDFTTELETSYSAGIPLVQAMEDLAKEEEHANFAKVLAAVGRKIKEGSSFSEALAAYPKTFPSLYVALTHAGEKTGTLDKILRNLVSFLEWQDDLVAQARQATIYPITIIMAVVGLIILLVSYVIPKFYDIFSTLRVELPLPTRILLGISSFFQGYGIELVVGLAGAVVGVYLAGKTNRGRWYLDTLKLRVPIFGPLFRKLLISRMTHNLAMMLAAGIEVAQAFTMTEKLLGNVVMADVISRARAKILAGGLFSEALGKSPFIPAALVRKLVVGESTGRMSASLELLSAQYDKEIPRAIKRFFSLLEPAILVTLGVVVGFVALSLFMPLYQLQSAVGNQ